MKSIWRLFNLGGRMDIKRIFIYQTINEGKYIFGIDKESIDFSLRLIENRILYIKQIINYILM